MLHIDGSFYLYLSVMILCLPVPWVSAALTAAAFHEVCHLSAIYLLRGRVDHIRIKPGGAEIHTSILSPKHELLCAAAGPAGSLLLLSLHPFVPRIALCAGFQGLFNLVPIYPLDGGRISYCLYSLFAPSHAAMLQMWTQRIFSWIVLLSVFLLAANFSFYYPLIFLVFMVLTRKIPCKQSQIRVQ